MNEGIIFDVKRFAVHDGPGIRTTVFLKGCPLKCSWCHNPESQGFGVETLEGRDGAVDVGRVVSVDEIIDTVEKDISFYDESGGGVTFSGGEPLVQYEFLSELLDRCGELDIHRAVDTCGHVSQEILLDAADRVDLFLYDLKLSDGAVSTRYTGVDSKLIQENLSALSATGAAIEIRIPIIPGITDAEDNIDALGQFVGELDRSLPVRLLGYHRAAMDKYPRFGMKAPLPDTKEPTDEYMEELRKTMRSSGLEIKE